MLEINHHHLPPPDKNGIIRALPEELSFINRKRISKFGSFMFMYDSVQNYWVRPRIHKADRKRHWEIMHEILAPIKCAAVLDLACGTGGAIPHLDRSNEYTGLDISYAMLRHASKRVKTKGFRNAVLIEGTAEELIFTDECFDMVLIDTSLHMIPKYRQCIKESARVIKRGGDLICSCPTVGINNEFDRLWLSIAEKRHLHSLTESNFATACSVSGLSYDRIGTNGGVLYFQALKK